MLLYKKGNERESLSDKELKEGLYTALDRLGPKKRILAIPPDFTRYHSRAGDLTRFAWEYYGSRLTDILPAIGTHSPMTRPEIQKMFERIPLNLFREHDWREGLLTLGEVPAGYIREVSEGLVDYSWPAQVNQLLVKGDYDLILSIGQVVPHEVIGMANYNKNIFVGTGGSDAINKSHFLGAVYGMERIMGRTDNPVRRVINYASDHFAKNLPIIYVHTVVSMTEDSSLVTRGLFIGDDIECFTLPAELSLKVNLNMLDTPLKKVVVYLDPSEYKSTWLGNKSIYRTRMALADQGELVVMAPGLKEFGEDPGIDKLIRKYGYVGTPRVLELVSKEDDLKENLSAAAHLIHGSSEGRFRITYCPGIMSKSEIESVNFKFTDLSSMMKRYNPEKLKEGYNRLPDGEQIYFISNPALGLWVYRERFEN